MLWGKARPKTVCPAHPLLCHMIDVAAVAARLVTEILPDALRQRLLAISADHVEALRSLLFTIALHDIGKATPAFQAKVDWARNDLPKRGFDLLADRGARSHGDIGLFFLKPELEQLGVAPASALSLSRAVTGHHGQFPTNACGLKPPGPRERGREPRWDDSRARIVQSVAGLFSVTALPQVAVDPAYVVLLAGLTSVADWLGSMDEFFCYEPAQASLAAYWPLALERAEKALDSAGFRAAAMARPKRFRDLFPQRQPWPLHEQTDVVAEALTSPALIIVEAPMGEGKTEAALVLANAAASHTGTGGFYFGLPTQATANQMFDRIEKFLSRTREGTPSTLLLAHGEASLWKQFEKLRVASVCDVDGDALGSVRAETWFLQKKRTLLGEFAVGTIDQTLLGVMRVPHGFVRIYGLASKVVIFDEIHAYDTYTSNLLDRLVEWLAATGTTVVLLSATLPSTRRVDLIRAYRMGAALPVTPGPDGAYPRITVTSRERTATVAFAPRAQAYSVGLTRAGDDVEELAQTLVDLVRQGACVGWICNTVGRAQAATECVRKLAAELPRLLLHSRLLPSDRVDREKRLAKWLGPEGNGTARPAGCVVIGTQVLEQSLDVDFDFMVTDVAPMDLLLQRAGRLWRHERRNRTPSTAQPRLAVVCPEGDWRTVSLDAVAPVYDNLLVRRTLAKLAVLDTLTLPTDIEPLVEAVYTDNPVVPEDPLYQEYLNHHGARAVERNLSEEKLMPHPFAPDDPFGDFRVFLTEDDDPVMHKRLRADTRLGPPSIEVVCVVRRGERIMVGDGDETPLELSREPDRPLVERLVRRSIGVSNKRAFHAVTNDPCTAPESWRRSSMLRFRRLVVFESGRAVIGDVNLVMDPELGLCIEQRNAAT